MEIRALRKFGPGFGKPEITLDKIYRTIRVWEDIGAVMIRDDRGFMVWLTKTDYVEVKE